MSKRERTVREHLKKPKNQRELADRLGVKPKYLTMGHWTPRSMRRGPQ